MKVLQPEEIAGNIFQRGIKAFFWMLLRMVYRIKVRGRHNIPEGPAILAPNHVAGIDAVLIAAHVGRMTHFAMYWKIFNKVAWIVEPMGAFPIASAEENPKVYAAAFDHMSKALDNGELVCIFPEGKLTTDGEIAAFRGGIMKLLQRNPVPVVPVALKGLWGTYFSKMRPGLFHMPDHFMHKIEIIMGRPLPPTCTLADIEKRVRRLNRA